MKMNLLNICISAQKAVYEISTLSNTKRNKILRDISIAIKENSKQILKANKLDQNNNKTLSSDPALTPMRIEQLLSLAAFKISLTFSLEPIFPGLILKQSAPEFAASIALL